MFATRLYGRTSNRALNSLSSILRATYSSGSSSTFFHKDLKIKKAETIKTLPPKDQLVFGANFSNHMLMVEWCANNGWGSPQIVPFGNLSVHPAASTLNYAMECFEGMKAYKGVDGKYRLFRPIENMKRLNNSAEFLGFPTFNPEEGLKCLEELVRLDKGDIPDGEGLSMYIRPSMIGTEGVLGVRTPKKVLLYVICSPSGPYFPTGLKATRLLTDPERVRAWPGGTGDKKLGSNYDGGMKALRDAAEKGYQQVLWTFGPEHNLSEAGTMNVFVYWINEAGEKELITPELDGTILPGITRDSVLKVCREYNEFKVTEGVITMKQVAKASKEGRLLEMFGCGTACVISPIKEIGYEGTDVKVPLDPKDPTVEFGPLTKRIYDHILGIQNGTIAHQQWAVTV
ncbi:Branched-chain-amino-acid aminotransferase [Zancudomyces culisetae]|uniref:Branched-chain-amino-acid aminotransferase n=1 Tax=Zancudomyces culisetae TaxID=1213189 RepID=A0A1R1PDZ6_ZANCU|nr:Branched-chain-amino-acid aminotransferase [Zancudomyces culisetae]|eukprot:OMH79220.1 Branched-chain-amino-acid aminotransferase [Zancudomyces culisetae]